MDRNYFTTREAAQVLNVSVRTAQQWVEKGYLVGWKTSGGHRRITRSSVEKASRERRPDGAEMQESASALPVLVVEDNQTLVELYRAHMEEWPFEVAFYTAPNGYEGLLMIGEVAPRLLICDLRLPGVNGFQIVRSICKMERYRAMAIVVVSGMDPAEIAAHGGIPAGVEIIGKPIDFMRLRTVAQQQWYRHTALPIVNAA